MLSMGKVGTRRKYVGILVKEIGMCLIVLVLHAYAGFPKAKDIGIKQPRNTVLIKFAGLLDLTIGTMRDAGLHHVYAGTLYEDALTNKAKGIGIIN
jgi:hypothetical protein